MGGHKKPGHYQKKYAKLIRSIANQEMNAQIRIIRELFVCNAFQEFQLVENCLQSDMRHGEMQLSPAMALIFDNVEELRNTIMSNHMYTCAPLYELFCKAIECGKLRQIPSRKPTPLQEMLTIAHQAHFRCEIAACMERQSFRHGLGFNNVRMRSKVFKVQCKLTAENRSNNGESAWLTRKQTNSLEGQQRVGYWRRP